MPERADTEVSLRILHSCAPGADGWLHATGSGRALLGQPAVACYGRRNRARRRSWYVLVFSAAPRQSVCSRMAGVVIGLWAFGFWWLFAHGGADFLVEHRGLLHELPRSATAIQIYYCLCVAGGICGLLFIFLANIPRFPPMTPNQWMQRPPELAFPTCVSQGGG